MRDNLMLTPGMSLDQGCPEPTRVEGIWVDKVFDSCFQMEDLPPQCLCILSDQTAIVPGTVMPCTGEEASISCVEIERRPLQTGLSEIDVLFRVENLRIINPLNTAESLPVDITPFIKTFTLHCPEGTVLDCSESRVSKCLCTVADVQPVDTGDLVQLQVICRIQLCLVVKCTARVQLLIPSYGICQPAPCVAPSPTCPSSPPPSPDLPCKP